MHFKNNELSSLANCKSLSLLPPKSTCEKESFTPKDLDEKDSAEKNNDALAALIRNHVRLVNLQPLEINLTDKAPETMVNDLANQLSLD